MEKEIKAKSQKEIFQEMLPFAVYAAIPILIVICIAYTFGSR